MAKKTSILCWIFALVAVCFISVGYASLSDTLWVTGTADVTPPTSMVITEITPTDATTVRYETSTRFEETNIKTTLNGTQGQKVVYRVTAHNYSKTDTYVFNGIRYSDVYADTLSKMTVSVSPNEYGDKLLSTTPQTISVEGTPVAPGEDFVFYVEYELTDNIGTEEILINYVFDTVKYTITYLDDNEIWAIDCIIDNGQEYRVKQVDDAEFVGWMNANAVIVQSYPKGNVNSYTLSAKWAEKYLIMFVDENGTVLYEEVFSENSTALSSAGQQKVNELLAQLQAEAVKDDMSVAWSSYDIKNATSDIVVHPIYTYTGMLRFTPVDKDGDGITDCYQIDAVSQLKDPVKIPGEYRGLPVEVVNKLYKNEGNFDFGAGIKTIEIGEGVTTLNHNSLAYTSDLTTVKLPNTLKYMNKNAFSRNTIGDQKKLTIEFNGTMAEWKQIVGNSHGEWHNGLKDGSMVKCSDGYFELDRGIFGLGGYTWKEHPN